MISIGEGAFGDNPLTAVTLREGLKEIGVCAFYDSSVVSVDIPSSVTTITLDLGLAVGKAVGGSTVTVSGVGLRSGSAYTVVVRSTPTTIAFGSAGADGTFTGTGVMPAGLAAGAHRHPQWHGCRWQCRQQHRVLHR